MLSLLYYIFSVVLSTVVLILSYVLLPFTLIFNRRRWLMHEMSRAMTLLFLNLPMGWKTRVEGLENIDKSKSYVIVANHQSMIDILAMYNIPLHFKWVSKREVYFAPMFGQFLWVQGNITIDRKSGRASLAKILSSGTKWLKQGVTIAIFPEGTRTKTGEMKPFKSGAFNLAKEANVEILPIVMDGTASLFKGKFYFNWGNQLKIKVLPPISAEKVQSMEMNELIKSVEGQMVETLKNMRG